MHRTLYLNYAGYFSIYDSKSCMIKEYQNFFTLLLKKYIENKTKYQIGTFLFQIRVECL